MFKNYLKIAFRNLWRHRVFSFINIMGSTVGMTAFFLIFMYVKFELSYDSFNSKANRIYRIVLSILKRQRKRSIQMVHRGQLRRI